MQDVYKRQALQLGITVAVHQRIQLLLVLAERAVMSLIYLIIRNIAGVKHGFHADPVDGLHRTEHRKDRLDPAPVIVNACLLYTSRCV